MYDDTEDTPAGVEPNEWDIPELTLEFRGDKGMVQFVSLEDLSGAQVDRLRSVIGGAKNEGEGANAMYLEAARSLIVTWDVPGKPTLPIPKGDPKAWGSIPAILRRQIERHMKTYLNKLMYDREDANADPFAPGGPTAPASA